MIAVAVVNNDNAEIREEDYAAALMAISLIQLIAIERAADNHGRLRAALLAAISLLALCLIHPQMLFVLAPLAFVFLIRVRPQPSTWLITALRRGPASSAR